MASLVLLASCRCGRSSAEPKQLVSGLSAAGTLEAGETASFRLPRTAVGDYLQVELVQKGADLRLLVEHPGAATDSFIDRLPTVTGRELASLIVESDHVPTIARVSGAHPRAAGAYSIVATVRPPTEQDRELAEGLSLLRQAKRMADEAGLRLADSAPLYERAASALRAAGHEDLAGLALDSMARSLDLLGDNHRAREIRLDNLAAQERRGDSLGQVRSHYGLGRVYSSIGKIESSIAHYEQAMALASDQNIPTLEARSAHNLAELLIDIGEYDAARKLLLRSLHLVSSLEDAHSIAIEHVSLSHLEWRVGNDEHALRHVQDASASLAQHNLVWDHGRALQQEAEIVLDGAGSGWQRGIELVQRAIERHEQVGDKRGLAASLRLLGLALQRQGKGQEALPPLRRALALVREMDEQIDAPGLLRVLGQALSGAGEHDEARATFAEALRLARTLDMVPEEARVLAAQARLQARVGELPAALASARAAIARIESVRLGLRDAHDRAGHFSFVRPIYDLYIDLLMRDPETSGLAALRASEASRSRTLSEILASAAISEHRPEARELRVIDLQLRRAEDRASRLRSQSASAPQIEAAEAEVSTLFRELQTMAGAERLRPRAPPALDLPGLQAALPPKTLIIEYVLTEERAYAWAIDRESVEGFDIGEAATLRRWLGRAVELARTPEGELISAGQETELAAISRELFQVLFGRILPGRDVRRLILIPDDELWRFPLAILPARGEASPTPGPRLVDSYRVSSAPAAHLLLRRSKRSPNASTGEGGGIAVFADPVFSSGDGRLADPRPGSTQFARLRFTQREAEAIAALDPSAHVAMGLDATQDEMQRDVVKRARILHMATHTVLDDVRPELSSVVLSQVDAQGGSIDGLLRLHEIYELELRAELVVLSGCESALGRAVRGEGFVGLARGFFSAGARSIVASLWRVEDRATAELMKHFYRGLIEERLTASEALARAQRALRADPRWSAPYYWAGFQLLESDLN